MRFNNRTQVNRYFNKKDELRHSLFQNLKVESMNNFIECYTASGLCWIQLPYFDILSHKITGKEVDEYVIPTHNKFTASYYKLFIILDSKEMLEFTEIYSSISEVNRLLGILMFDYDEKKISS
ncbi:hypothetical protein [Pedobacter borealis]|uniref:hypothetical protein n=1 Tax=Pedobacter borealis TaxID=475254 RepID=UPI0004930980|nr:hypothetical protein [Pedobacter borealis]